MLFKGVYFNDICECIHVYYGRKICFNLWYMCGTLPQHNIMHYKIVAGVHVDIIQTSEI